MKDVIDMERRYKLYRYFLISCLLSALILFGISFRNYVKYEIPDEMKIYANESTDWDNVFESPFVTYDPYVEVSQSGGYQLTCYLLGVVPLKTVNVQIVEPQYVYASGSTIGIYMETQGVLVVDSGVLQDENGISCSPAKHIIQSGDYIYKVNGQTLTSKKQLMQMVEKSEGSSMEFEILRENEMITLELTPVLTDDGSYKLGIWVRDNIQGIGTMTYIDQQGNFAALGHGIRDIDTGENLNISNGALYNARILSVQKGVSGTPGELQGVIDYKETNYLGTIIQNTETGILGKLDKNIDEVISKKLYPVGFKQEVEKGPATILCGEGQEVEEYQIEIIDITWNSKDSKKSMKIQVTDERLLEKTGGIVQGMSGSPIIQDGKLVGAVTHVLVNDPTRGYGIFIENMLEAVE